MGLRLRREGRTVGPPPRLRREGIMVWFEGPFNLLVLHNYHHITTEPVSVVCGIVVSVALLILGRTYKSQDIIFD